jgi:hypothetical protein
MTAPTVFEELAAVHLNMVAAAPDESVAYVAAEPNVDQEETPSNNSPPKG